MYLSLDFAPSEDQLIRENPNLNLTNREPQYSHHGYIFEACTDEWFGTENSFGQGTASIQTKEASYLV